MTDRVKLLYIIGTLDVGGTEGQLVQLAKNLDKTRFSPIVCCLSTGGPHAKALNAAGIPIEIIGFRGFTFRHPHRVAIRLFRLVRFLRHTGPDIVHGFLFWAYLIGTFAARLARVPFVVTSRRSLGHFKSSKSLWLLPEKIANRMTDLVIANSQAVREDAIRQENLPDDKIEVIYNGLEPGRFDSLPDEQLRRSLNLQAGNPVIGVIANFIHYKGLHFFIDALNPVVSRFPDSVALLLGDGPLRGELEAKVDAMKLRKSVRFLGTRRDVSELLALTDLVVHPSLEEGFPNVILEAMAAGKPVVATVVGGTPEAVVGGKTGILVPARDSQALAQAILRMLEHPDEAIQMGQAGRRRVSEHFELSGMVRQYEKLYERLVGQKCPREEDQKGADRFITNDDASYLRKVNVK